MTTLKEYLAKDDLSGRATVTDVLEDGRILRLDRTLFHAQGGGQRADTGTIAGVAVTGVKHADNGDVDHHLASSVDLSVGDEVDIAVDETSRSINARYHSAGHLIADAVESLGLGLRAVQGHHWPGEARVEFEGGNPDSGPDVETIQSALDELIERVVDFQIVGDPYTSRALKIGAFKPVGCGGTHVKSSADLTGLTVGKVKHRKGRLRVSYTM